MSTKEKILYPIILALYSLVTYPAYKGGSLIVQGNPYGWLVAGSGIVYIALVYFIGNLVFCTLRRIKSCLDVELVYATRVVVMVQGMKAR